MLFRWGHFKREGRLLHKYLKVDEGSVNLTFADGLFIAPDDYVNQRSSLPKILLKTTIIDLIAKKHPDMFRDIAAVCKFDEGLDKKNYLKFKIRAKLAYYFAAAVFVTERELTVSKASKLYSSDMQREINARLVELNAAFYKMAAEAHVPIRLEELFNFAGELLKRRDIPLKSTFERYNAFLKSPGYYPYGNLLGNAVEDEIQGLFENTGKRDLVAEIASRFGDGILIPLDEDHDFKLFANRKAKGLPLPDYLYVSRAHHIHPIDLKANLSFAKPRQISAVEVRRTFDACREKLAIIFGGISVEGVLV